MNPLAKQGTLHHCRFPSRRVGSTSIRLAAPPYDLSHSGLRGPAVLDQKPRRRTTAGNCGNLLSYGAWAAASSDRSSFTPGPIVLETVTFFT